MPFVDENTDTPRISRWRRRLVVIVSTLLVVGVVTLWWAEEWYGNTIVVWARRQAETRGTIIINNAVAAYFGSEASNIEMMEIISDANHPPVIRYNTVLLNRTINEIVAQIATDVEMAQTEEIDIPLGELTGMTMLAARGPKIPLKIMLTGSVTAEPKVEFSAAGVNQVSHRIYVDVELLINIVAPLVEVPVVVKQPILLADAIIPGEVPSTYVNLMGYSGSFAEWAAIMGATGSLHEANKHLK